jgi:hypothetical protein
MLKSLFTRGEIIGIDIRASLFTVSMPLCRTALSMLSIAHQKNASYDGGTSSKD